MSVREDAILNDTAKTIVFSTLRIARGMDNEADRHFLQINQTKQMASQIKHSLLKILLNGSLTAILWLVVMFV